MTERWLLLHHSLAAVPSRFGTSPWRLFASASRQPHPFATPIHARSFHLYNFLPLTVSVHRTRTSRIDTVSILLTTYRTRHHEPAHAERRNMARMARLHLSTMPQTSSFRLRLRQRPPSSPPHRRHEQRRACCTGLAPALESERTPPKDGKEGQGTQWYD